MATVLARHKIGAMEVRHTPVQPPSKEPLGAYRFSGVILVFYGLYNLAGGQIGEMVIGHSGSSGRPATCAMHLWKERMGLGPHRPTLDDLYMNYSPEDATLVRSVKSGTRRNATSINIRDKERREEFWKESVEARKVEKKMIQKLLQETLSRARKRYRFYQMLWRRRGF